MNLTINTLILNSNWVSCILTVSLWLFNGDMDQWNRNMHTIWFFYPKHAHYTSKAISSRVGDPAYNLGATVQWHLVLGCLNFFVKLVSQFSYSYVHLMAISFSKPIFVSQLDFWLGSYERSMFERKSQCRLQVWLPKSDIFFVRLCPISLLSESFDC